MRFWLFVEGSGGIPSWSTDPSNGNHVVVNGTDSAGTLAEDMKKYLQVAASMDILIVWTLWNGAVLRDNRTLGMIIEPDGTTLQSFIDNALTPLVIALKDQPGLGGWEIMNEPEGTTTTVCLFVCLFVRRYYYCSLTIHHTIPYIYIYIYMYMYIYIYLYLEEYLSV